ncbi:MAG: DUF1559 domain-containing protein [Pirellulaceae bacterium]
MSSDFDHRRTEPPRRVPVDRATLWGCGAILLVVAGLFYWVFWPAYHDALRAARRMHSQSRFDQMRLALFNYHDVHGTFPPAYIPDENEKPMHSWRVLILPFVSEEALWEQYDFDLPWNDPHNLEVSQNMPGIYSSPFSPEEAERGLTPYLAITGPETVLGESEGRTIAELGSDANHKFVMIQYYSQPVLWTEPVDITPDQILAEYFQIMDNLIDGISVMVIRGDNLFVPADTPPEDLEAGFYVGDGRKLVQGDGRAKETQ